MKRLYIIGENHPWYYVGHPEVGRIFQQGIEKEEEIIRTIRPDTIFVEFPENWGLEDEVKYKLPYFRELEKKCGREISEEMAREIIRRGYEARMRFYSKLAENSRLVFLENRENYEEMGRIIVEVEKNPSIENVKKFYEVIERRESNFSSKIKESNFKIGVVTCGLSHIVRNGEIAPWIDELERLCDIEIFELDIKNYF